MAEETSSFKVTLYLEGSSGKNEIRRFVLPKNALTDFLFLEEKLKTLFQSLQSLPFSVAWEDSEGDEVLISSDEELKVAIKEMKGEVYRLKLEAKSGSGLKDENAEVHPRVHCDCCGGEVKGFRYKCIQCPNYDLCSACEMKCLHKEHYMIRLPQPIAFPQVLQYLLRNARDSNDDVSSARDSNDFGAEGAAAPPQNESERKDVDKASQDKDDSRSKYLKTIGETVSTPLDPLARMAEDTSSFRATLYLEGSSGKHEVRRFILPKNASTDFLFLEKKLKTVFQSLHSLPFSVIWEDSEGEVLISSDEELKIALNKMKGEDYSLKIEVKSASGLKDENAEARMAEETSSFKATLYHEGSSGKNEIRCFDIPKNASTDFLFLEQKLKTVFQSLHLLPFCLTWEDSEGDEVLISSDEELKIALNKMIGEDYRLKIQVKSASGLKDENAEDNKTEEVPPQPLHFHERTGAYIKLSNGNRTAERYGLNFDGGSVITNRPLKDNELFEVRFDTIIGRRWNDFSFGVTVANPSTVSFKDHWSSFNDGVWLYLGDGIFHNGDVIQSEYGIYLNTMKVGDRVGVMRKSNGSLHFFVNGADQGAIPSTVPETVYVVMDVYGGAVQATIVKP